jgi:hypothetical protein
MAQREPAVDFVVAVIRLQRELPAHDEDYKQATTSLKELLHTLPLARRMRLAGDIVQALLLNLVESWVTKSE